MMLLLTKPCISHRPVCSRFALDDNRQRVLPAVIDGSLRSVRRVWCSSALHAASNSPSNTPSEPSVHISTDDASSSRSGTVDTAEAKPSTSSQTPGDALHPTQLDPVQVATVGSLVQYGSSAVTPYTPGQAPPPSAPRSFSDRVRQLLIVVGLFAVFVIMPFLQPTWLYGSSSPAPARTETMLMQQTEESLRTPNWGPVEFYRYITSPIQPSKNGEIQSPGVFAIYVTSLAMLAALYATSFVLSVATRAVQNAWLDWRRS